MARGRPCSKCGAPTRMLVTLWFYAPSKFEGKMTKAIIRRSDVECLGADWPTISFVCTGCGHVDCCGDRDWPSVKMNAAVLDLIELKRENDALKDAINFGRNEWSRFGGRFCPLCEYKNGVFIRKCRLHEDMDDQEQVIRDTRKALRTALVRHTSTEIGGSGSVHPVYTCSSCCAQVDVHGEPVDPKNPHTGKYCSEWF